MADEDTIDLLATEALPTDPFERLEHLRLLARGERYVLPYCPECGIALETIDPAAHAEFHWPPHVPGRFMSQEAVLRERALYQLAGQSPPRRF